MGLRKFLYNALCNFFIGRNKKIIEDITFLFYPNCNIILIHEDEETEFNYYKSLSISCNILEEKDNYLNKDKKVVIVFNSDGNVVKMPVTFY